VTRDQGAAGGQQTYTPIGRCGCGCLETLHAISETTGKRAACSNSNCGCRRYTAAAPGPREAWIVISGVGGYVCAEPDPGRPDAICGMPVESEPCNLHPDRLVAAGGGDR
jgi:hypothetical protein